MRNVEIMTPILPNVSAKTCRNTPRNVKEKYVKSTKDRHKYIDYTEQQCYKNSSVKYLPCILVLREQDCCE